MNIDAETRAMIGIALLESLPGTAPKRRSWVYSLNDPLTGEPRYFGKSVNVTNRLSAHRRCALEGHSSRLYAWIRDLAAVGLEPECLPLIEADSDLEARCFEASIIALCRLAGVPLLNVNRGGEGKASEDRGVCLTHGAYGMYHGCPKCRPEYLRKSSRKYRAANLERVRESNREYARKWYEANRERRAEYARKWYEANRERAVETSRKRYEANRERRAETARKWRDANRERKAETDRKWRAKKKAEKLASTQAQPVSVA